MNVKSRKMIGLSVSDKLSQELASAALRDTVGRQSPSEGLIHHYVHFDQKRRIPPPN